MTPTTPDNAFSLADRYFSAINDVFGTAAFGFAFAAIGTNEPWLAAGIAAIFLNVVYWSKRKSLLDLYFYHRGRQHASLVSRQELDEIHKAVFNWRSQWRNGFIGIFGLLSLIAVMVVDLSLGGASFALIK